MFFCNILFTDGTEKTNILVSWVILVFRYTSISSTKISKDQPTENDAIQKELKIKRPKIVLMN